MIRVCPVCGEIVYSDNPQEVSVYKFFKDDPINLKQSNIIIYKDFCQKHDKCVTDFDWKEIGIERESIGENYKYKLLQKRYYNKVAPYLLDIRKCLKSIRAADEKLGFLNDYWHLFSMAQSRRLVPGRNNGLNQSSFTLQTAANILGAFNGIYYGNYYTKDEWVLHNFWTHLKYGELTHEFYKQRKH